MTRRTLKLVFEAGTEFAGRTVRVESMTIDEWLATRTMAEELDFFADRLVDWDWVDDDGHPVPPTRAGVGGCDASDMLSLVSHWNREATRIRPLGQSRKVRSTSNGHPIEEGIPMAPIEQP